MDLGGDDAAAGDDAMDVDAEPGDAMVNAVMDTNVDDEHEAWFQADEMTDEWESEQLNRIDPALITAAKKKELEQIHARGTFDVCRREDLPEGIKVIGSRWFL